MVVEANFFSTFLGFIASHVDYFRGKGPHHQWKYSDRSCITWGFTWNVHYYPWEPANFQKQHPPPRIHYQTAKAPVLVRNKNFKITSFYLKNEWEKSRHYYTTVKAISRYSNEALCLGQFCQFITVLLFSNSLSGVDDVGIPSARHLLLVIVGSIYVQLLPII